MMEEGDLSRKQRLGGKEENMEDIVVKARGSRTSRRKGW